PCRYCPASRTLVVVEHARDSVDRWTVMRVQDAWFEAALEDRCWLSACAVMRLKIFDDRWRLNQIKLASMSHPAALKLPSCAHYLTSGNTVSRRRLTALTPNTAPIALGRHTSPPRTVGTF